MERIKKGESLEKGLQDFAGGPVVKNVLPVQGMGSIPGWRTKIPHVSKHGQKIKQKNF